jgi:hypothetical protein
MGDLFQPWHLIVISSVAFPFVIIPFWQIFKKAGFPAPLSLLMLVPVAGLIVLFFVAFSEWPALRKPNARPGWAPPAS